MKSGDKVKVVKGEDSGRVGWIKKIDIINDGTYTVQKLTLEDEHKHRYLVDRDDVELIEGNKKI